MNGLYNLNQIPIRDDTSNGMPQSDFSNEYQAIAVYFKSLETHLIRYILKADVVLGCVAWLTHTEILDALSKRQSSIIVQKEDLWRPDLGENGFENKMRLSKLYSKLHCNILRYQLRGIAPQLSVGGDPTLEPIRCVGNYNSDKAPAFPRSHHKFLVFCRNHETELSPYAVWTGSFNFTFNAGQSFENAVYIESEEIALSYAKEFSQILALSEPLNWMSKWVEPEYRIGS